MLPTDTEILELHHTYAPDDITFDLIYTHSVIVAEIAQQILDKLQQRDIDAELVRVGSLLHDIGAYKMFSQGIRNSEPYIRHGIEGQMILETEKMPQALCRIASRHTGVGLTKKEIVEKGLPLPPEDYFAESLEEELIMYADKFHSKAPKFNTYENYIEHASQFGAANVNKFEKLAAKFGRPDLEALSRKYGHPIV